MKGFLMSDPLVSVSVGVPPERQLRAVFTNEVIRAIAALARQREVCREQAGQAVFVSGMDAAREYIVEHAQPILHAALEAATARLASQQAHVEALEKERDELLLDRHQPGRISACGHYRVFTMPCLHEDGTEQPSCMQCDRDAAQDRAEQAEAERDALTARLARVEALAKQWDEWGDWEIHENNNTERGAALYQCSKELGEALASVSPPPKADRDV
jgi:hypothetical protein